MATDQLYDIYIHSTEGFKWAMNGIPETVITILATALVIGICAGLYWLFFMPYIRVRDFHEVGYEYLKCESKRRNIKHRDLVNHVRSLKKLDSLPPPYPNGWFALAEIKDVPNGTVKSVTALGQHFAVFRTNEGKVYVVDAYCPHLGADLGVGGRVIGNCIECPFHGWQFDGKNGECIHIPYTDKIPAFAKIKTWTAVERMGWVFVWHHADDAEPEWILDEIEQIPSGEYIFHGRSEYIVNAHIQIGPGIVLIHLDMLLGTALFVQIQCPIGPMKVRLATNIYASKYMPSPLAKAIMLIVMLKFGIFLDIVDIINNFTLRVVRSSHLQMILMNGDFTLCFVCCVPISVEWLQISVCAMLKYVL
uniref:Rieske domain-containing protein n=1 Tax=Strigamia maritima TaxID=126957 RepID=T1JNQ2_STRMM